MGVPLPRDILLSEKHGLNPAIPVCFFCGEEKKQVLLLGKLQHTEESPFGGRVVIEDDIEAPRKSVWDLEPCDKCSEYMEQGIILISAREARNKEEQKNPYRTGGWVVLKEEAFKRLFDGMDAQKRNVILAQRAAFITDETWDAFGLPRG